MKKIDKHEYNLEKKLFANRSVCEVLRVAWKHSEGWPSNHLAEGGELWGAWVPKEGLQLSKNSA